MSENIIVTFSLLFGAIVALICAIYVALTERKRRRKELEEYNNQNQEMEVY